MRILALGDVVGRPGRQALKKHVSCLRRELALDFVFANGENAAGGIGLTHDTLDEILSCGVDVVTGGNHIWKHRELYARMDADVRVLRPANYPDAPGRGYAVYSLGDGREIALCNLQGLTYMDALPCPFRTAFNWVEELEAKKATKIRLVDFHAEATSEKKTLGLALDGRVSAVLGTHTHVQCADAQILPQRTAYLTDLGMCGVEISSLGMDASITLERFLSRRPVAFKAASGQSSLNGAFLDIDDESGLAREIRLIRLDAPETTRTQAVQAGYREDKEQSSPQNGHLVKRR